MRVQLEPDLSATNVSMVPAEIEALPESKVLVSNPPPNYEYTIITEVLSDFMRHNQGVAMAFDLLGNGSEVKDQTLDLWQGREPL
ncbi:unnamed protein product [Tilletia controversa]|nr:unnamed protein product [Tilletia controversa]CAD6901301.1 unnamed protein product [Tilletia controversa]CAD7060041.1 unnamed protein product [Tilletia caries]